jgi:hypothetical protein
MPSRPRSLCLLSAKLVGVDCTDVREAAGSGRGLPHVIPGVLNVAEDLEASRDDLSARSFTLGFLLVQLPETSDWPLYTLQGLDDLTERLFASVSCREHVRNTSRRYPIRIVRIEQTDRTGEDANTQRIRPRKTPS